VRLPKVPIRLRTEVVRSCVRLSEVTFMTEVTVRLPGVVVRLSEEVERLLEKAMRLPKDVVRLPEEAVNCLKWT
jgi:hypothetical protein